MHVNVIEHDHALAHQLVELRKKLLDPLGGIDDDHGDGQVLGQAEQATGVDPARGAVALQASEHTGSRQAGLMGPVHDLGVERPVTAPVALAHLGDPAGIAAAGRAVSALTHHDPLAADASEDEGTTWRKDLDYIFVRRGR